ncbi:MAG: hypothetical protein Q8S13_11370, partial [Dehalococcoidia bacterium]|nr:hypothetical protein [Dehalococcoidia bacterium]
LPDDARTIASTGMEPHELWAVTSEPAHQLAVLSRPRTARDLYRVLALLERLILPGGAILLAPYQPPDGAAENRFEATEVFLGVYPTWTRCLRGGNVVELRKGGVAATVNDSGASRFDNPAVGVVGGGREAPLFNPSTGKRVISLAVWGEGGYWAYLPAFVRAHHTLFPGYELRVHHDDGIFNAPYGAAMFGLQARNLVRLVNMPARDGEGKCQRMLWRLAPAWDDEVGFVFARDLDALPTWRERCVVEEFLASAMSGETDTSAIHDNTAHSGLMGGMSGFRASVLRAFATTFEDFIAAAGFDDARWAQHGADQDYLNAKIAPRMRIFEHSVFRWLDEDGVTRRYRKPSDWSVGGPRNTSIQFVTDIAPFEDARVPAAIREQSNGLIPYLGAAGYPIDRAIEFYNKACQVIDQIRDAEREAGEAVK